MSGLRLPSLYPLIALTLLAAGTVWLERATRSGEAKLQGPPRHDPDVMIQSFTLRRFDKAGAQQYQLTGTRMTHFPDDDSTVVAQPQLLFTGQGRPLKVTAAQGTGYEQGQRVFLEGDVHVHRTADAEHAAMDFRSPTLTVWPDEERAATRTPLVMTQGLTVVRARGMEAQNLTGKLFLEGGVTARFQRGQPSVTPTSASSP